MFKSFLSKPRFYNLFQRILGSDNSRKKFVESYIYPNNSHNVLDLGCGTADILNYLPKVNYTGIDASANYIKLAKQKFPSLGSFRCATFDENTRLNGKYDLVIAIGFLHHLNKVTCEKLIINASKVLTPKGRLITFDPILYKGQNKFASWIIKQDRGKYIRDLRNYTSLFSKKKFSSVEFDIRQDLIRIPYTHVISVCKK